MRSLIPLLALATSLHAGTIDLSKPVSDSLKPDIVYWPLDGGEIGGNQPNPVEDASGNGFNAYLLQGENGEEVPSYVEGKFGTAVRLKGRDSVGQDPHINWRATDSFAAEPDKLNLSGAAFTAGAWVRLEQEETRNGQTIVVFERGQSAGETSYVNLYLRNGGNDRWSLRLHALGGYADASTPFALDQGEWHHVAVSVEPMEEGIRVLFWFDGQQVGQSTRPQLSIPEPTREWQHTLSVGERNVSHHHSYTDFSVDDFFITSGIVTFTY